jgi:hypothetical protein
LREAAVEQGDQQAKDRHGNQHFQQGEAADFSKK